MSVQLVPPGDLANLPSVLQSLYDAVKQLQQPDHPSAFVIVDTKANLPTASDWPGCGVLCAEINAFVVSTLVSTTWTWLRADGGAL